MGLGFERDDVIQVFFACEKNEEMAANMLFDRQANGDFDDQVSINFMNIRLFSITLFYSLIAALDQ